MLDVIGLTPAEEELYRCRLQLTTARVDELVRSCDAPGRRSSSTWSR
ncbi:hypothetical protein [Micromonospora sp. NBC_00617]